MFGTTSLLEGGRSAARLAAAAICLALAACGGDSSAPIDRISLLKVSVVDTYGAAVPGATVTGPHGAVTTDAQGVTVLAISDAPATAELAVSNRPAFEDKTVTASVTPGATSTVEVTLQRVTAPAGGSLTSRSGVPILVDGTAQQLTFEVELIVLDGDGQPVTGLGAGDFVLQPCTPDAASAQADCLRGRTPDIDVAYVPAAAAPEAVAVVPGQPAQPYAAALLLDQSGSIAQSDPTGARLFSAKSFLGSMGDGDRTLLAAFASDPGALIPTPPLTVYGPFRDRVAAPEYFATLDALRPLAAGGTPLYGSIDSLRAQVVGDATLPAGLAKAIVVFTDGEDTTCGGADTCAAQRDASIAGANADAVRLFTIGLSSAVDIGALGELANRTGGVMLYADTAEQLLPLYGSVGRLLSLSLPTYRLRWTVRSDTPGAFSSGAVMLGKVAVSTPQGGVGVPFVVGIP